MPLLRVLALRTVGPAVAQALRRLDVVVVLGQPLDQLGDAVGQLDV